MSGSINKATLLGHLGRDPEIRSTTGGDKIANLSVATSESWRDKASGERKEKTEWHRVTIFNPGLAEIAEKYLRKGSKVYLEGAIQTRSWEKDGQKVYTTEIVIQRFGGALVLLDGKSGEREEERPARVGGHPPRPAEMDEEIPFAPMMD
jgi:single-strand DNA-binding protein